MWLINISRKGTWTFRWARRIGWGTLCSRTNSEDSTRIRIKPYNYLEEAIENSLKQTQNQRIPNPKPHCLQVTLATHQTNSTSSSNNRLTITPTFAWMSTGHPNGPLSGPLATQESAMFLKPTQLAKGEKVVRIIDFVDKIVTSTHCY